MVSMHMGKYANLFKENSVNDDFYDESSPENFMEQGED